MAPACFVPLIVLMGHMFPPAYFQLMQNCHLFPVDVHFYWQQTESCLPGSNDLNSFLKVSH
eukprot:7257239-Ditylum_brightwellii.AAC.1